MYEIFLILCMYGDGERIQTKCSTQDLIRTNTKIDSINDFACRFLSRANAKKQQQPPTHKERERNVDNWNEKRRGKKTNENNKWTKKNISNEKLTTDGQWVDGMAYCNECICVRVSVMWSNKSLNYLPFVTLLSLFHVFLGKLKTNIYELNIWTSRCDCLCALALLLFPYSLLLSLSLVFSLFVACL